jgi:large subunit ribosomal protein L23
VEIDPETLKPQLLFEVAKDANKVEIRHAVEKLWNVDVVDVRTAIVRGKEKRMGRFVGRRSNWKKAIVTIAAGQNIEFFEGV